MTAGDSTEPIRYKRSRFTARLPVDRLYTRSHYWISDQGGGVHRVGFTRFAKRMLGEIVEYDFEVEPGARVELGRIIGWVEAFKAVSDIYNVVDGEFVGPNPRMADDPELIDRDPHGEGWLYAVRGEPDAGCVDAHGYTRVLDEKIDQMLGERDERYE